MMLEDKDNGSNMKGKHQGVQNDCLISILEFFYTPYGCHLFNWLFSNIANYCPKAIILFGVLAAHLFIFSSSIKK